MQSQPTSISIPPTIETLLEQGATLLLSVSGGKDSQAMTSALVRYHWAKQYPGQMLMIHAHLGAMERTETRPFIERQAELLGLPLVVLQNDLLAHIEARYTRLVEQGRAGVVPFPDAKNRYCTSDLKRNPINKYIRQTFPGEAQIICALGLRADESRARAKKPVYQLRAHCNAPRKGRLVYDWNPIHHWTIEDVWHEIGYSLEALESIQDDIAHLKANHNQLTAYYLDKIEFGAHPAYAHANERLSCAMCILGCKGDLINGAHNRPDTYRRLVALELQSGKSYRQGLWLTSLAPQLLTDEQRSTARAMGIL